jgi:PAS domain S-box-containing protein
MRFRDLTENTSDWIWEVDTRMRYVYASPQVAQLLGYTPEEILGKTPFDFMPPAEAARVRNFLNEMKPNPKPFHNLENVNQCKDGSLRVLETSGIPIRNIHGQFTGFRGIDRDITERKKAEEAIRESESKYRSIVLAAPIGVGVVVDRVFKEVNESVCTMTGYNREELLGRSARIV